MFLIFIFIFILIIVPIIISCCCLSSVASFAVVFSNDGGFNKMPLILKPAAYILFTFHILYSKMTNSN